MQKDVKSSDILLSLNGFYLVVFKDINDKICVRYENCEVKEGYALVLMVGRGNDFESACDSYLSQIRGKTLVFNSTSENRKEVTVLG